MPGCRSAVDPGFGKRVCQVSRKDSQDKKDVADHLHSCPNTIRLHNSLQYTSIGRHNKIHMHTIETKDALPNINRTQSTEMAENVAFSSQRETKHASSVSVWRKSVQRFPVCFIHKSKARV